MYLIIHSRWYHIKINVITTLICEHWIIIIGISVFANNNYKTVLTLWYLLSVTLTVGISNTGITGIVFNYHVGAFLLHITHHIFTHG